MGRHSDSSTSWRSSVESTKRPQDLVSACQRVEIGEGSEAERPRIQRRDTEGQKHGSRGWRSMRGIRSEPQGLPDQACQVTSSRKMSRSEKAPSHQRSGCLRSFFCYEIKVDLACRKDLAFSLACIDREPSPDKAGPVYLKLRKRLFNKLSNMRGCQRYQR